MILFCIEFNGRKISYLQDPLLKEKNYLVSLIIDLDPNAFHLISYCFKVLLTRSINLDNYIEVLEVASMNQTLWWN